MIGILSTIAPPFNREQIKSQALWAATQAVLLIQEHKVRKCAAVDATAVKPRYVRRICCRLGEGVGVGGGGGVGGGVGWGVRCDAVPWIETEPSQNALLVGRYLKED